LGYRKLHAVFTLTLLLVTGKAEARSRNPRSRPCDPSARERLSLCPATSPSPLLFRLDAERPRVDAALVLAGFFRPVAGRCAALRPPASAPAVEAFGLRFANPRPGRYTTRTGYRLHGLACLGFATWSWGPLRRRLSWQPAPRLFRRS
jgi:hypothetical protein